MEFVISRMHHRVIISLAIYFLLSTLSSLPLLVSLLFLSLVSLSVSVSITKKTPSVPGYSITLLLNNFERGVLRKRTTILFILVVNVETP